MTIMAADLQPTKLGAAPVAIPLAMRDRPGVPVLTIMRFVCEQYDLTQTDLCSRRQMHHLVQVRHIAFWLCKELSLASYPQIGRLFGDRDHTTVMHGVRRINFAIANGLPIGEQATVLKAVLEGSLQ